MSVVKYQNNPLFRTIHRDEFLTPFDQIFDEFFKKCFFLKLKKFCGLASYLRIKPSVRTIEVGWITYAKNLQKTVEATEAMYLMMKNIFENLGYRRYEWKCDNLNKKSNNSSLLYNTSANEYKQILHAVKLNFQYNKDDHPTLIKSPKTKKMKTFFKN